MPAGSDDHAPRFVLGTDVLGRDLATRLPRKMDGDLAPEDPFQDDLRDIRVIDMTGLDSIQARGQRALSLWKKYNVRLNWNYRGRSRNNLVTGNGIEPGTFNWTSKRLYLDVVGEYTLWKQTAFFFNLRNVGDATEDVKVFGPNTPEVARFRTRIDYASLWTFGLKGTW